MKENLFVYGTLGPGRPNEHILSNIGGTWREASVIGLLKDQGWAAEMGYPGLELNDVGTEISGFVFSSENLSKHWHSLDEFEGSAYLRVVTKVRLANGSFIDAHLYTLR